MKVRTTREKSERLEPMAMNGLAPPLDRDAFFAMRM
jgi:hypothetical protein